MRRFIRREIGKYQVELTATAMKRPEKCNSTKLSTWAEASTFKVEGNSISCENVFESHSLSGQEAEWLRIPSHGALSGNYPKTRFSNRTEGKPFWSTLDSHSTALNRKVKEKLFESLCFKTYGTDFAKRCCELKRQSFSRESTPADDTPHPSRWKGKTSKVFQVFALVN